MSIFTFIAALLVSVGLFAFGAVLFVRSFVFLTKATLSTLVFALSAAKKLVAVRSEKAVIEPQTDEAPASAEAELVATQVHIPEDFWKKSDWEQYEQPAFLRRGAQLVW